VYVRVRVAYFQVIKDMQVNKLEKMQLYLKLQMKKIVLDP
jgi:hypothetical protein